MLPLDRWAVDCAFKAQQQITSAFDDYNFLVATQTMHHFCAMDMGSFYLDIIKDRQYTAKAGSLAHKSCQTALYHIMQAMVRWFMPVMSFTAQELWSHIPGNDKDTMFWETWYDGLFPNDVDAIIGDVCWSNIARVKDEVNRKLESLRKENGIGSSLEAEVTLYVNGELAECLEKLEDELRFVLITSQAKIVRGQGGQASELEGLGIDIVASQSDKCERCWHRRSDVGENDKHPSLCNRCVENVDGEGEIRQYA
jgi:isoleucyl-tRNA synthetase